MSAYWKAGERDETVNVRNAATFAASCRYAGVVGVMGAGKQLIERHQASFSAAGDMLTVDLLQTQDVSAQAHERRPQDQQP
jgi:hypothetical protein